MSEQSILKKSYVNLIALKNNLPSSGDVEEKYVSIYNTEVDKLINLEFDVEEFKIPEEEIVRKEHLSNYATGEMSYSKEKYVDRGIFLMKLDALLSYFSISSPGMQIGFKVD